MAAPSRGLYIFVSICCFMVIPLGILAPKVGPKLIDAWKFRKLGRPVEQKGPVVGYVVSGGAGGESILLDLSGKELRRWKTGGSGFSDNDCFGLDCLSNGNVLFGGGAGEWGKGGPGWVREFDREGKEVWRLPDAAQLGRVTAVQRLANGNTLVAEGDAGCAREFTSQGKEVWRYQDDPHSIFDAARLRNGNTLLALSDTPAALPAQSGGRVREVDPRGTTIWECRSERKSELFSARRLANGNTLLAGSGSGEGVEEIDPAGRVVWRHDADDGAASAERLPDGRTLVSAYLKSHLLLVSPDGRKELFYDSRIHIGRACPVYAGH